MSKRTEAVTQIRDLPDDELAGALDRARDEYFRVRLGHYTNQVPNTVTIREKRREVARILTVMRGRQLGTEGASRATAATEKDE
ncbi:MAG TPA: 50S ribosomal protein L29 [Kofleriaceae bacterium]|nr:50S ribosomal protein L29 [Kofleriaceae bacterium]